MLIKQLVFSRAFERILMKKLSEKCIIVIILAIAFNLAGAGLKNTNLSLIKFINLNKFQTTKPESEPLRQRTKVISRGFDRGNQINGIVHKRVKRYFNKKPAIVNILIVDPKVSGATIKPSFGSYFLNSVNKVRDIVHFEDAVAGINASYFKPDIGIPLGTSIIDGNIITGPLYKRVSLGITKDKDFKMGRIDINGEIKIGDKLNLSLFNINQPVFSKYRFTVFTDKWGMRTPKTSQYYSHVVVVENRVAYIKNSSVEIPKGGYVIVGPHKYLAKKISFGDKVSYSAHLIPDKWNDVEYAIGGGPYLVKNGRIFIDKQAFSTNFLWSKDPRTAVGYTKSGKLILVTIDGRNKGVSEGATLYELAIVMWELGAYNAMNLDGGSSTQMVVNGKIVNNPVKGGCKVTNALLVIIPALNMNN